LNPGPVTISDAMHQGEGARSLGRELVYHIPNEEIGVTYDNHTTRPLSRFDRKIEVNVHTLKTSFGKVEKDSPKTNVPTLKLHPPNTNQENSSKFAQTPQSPRHPCKSVSLAPKSVVSSRALGTTNDRHMLPNPNRLPVRYRSIYGLAPSKIVQGPVGCNQMEPRKMVSTKGQYNFPQNLRCTRNGCRDINWICRFGDLLRLD
jgi:hypothetical protein